LDAREQDSSSGEGLFSTTQWSIVLAAGDSRNPEADTALTALFETYWYPVYGRIRQTHFGVDDARDLTQGFFVHLLEKNALAVARPDRGRFRSFLRTTLRNYLINENEREGARKRGGGQKPLAMDFAEGEKRYGREPKHRQDPEKLFERQWARTVLSNALERLRSEFETSPERHRWHRLENVLTGEPTGQRYRDLAEELGMSESAVKVSVHRLRKRYGEVLRDEVARTVGDRADIDEEVRYLLTVVRS
jgi:RNA polymerase sigma-70 factor (ECF subfamily)